MKWRRWRRHANIEARLRAEGFQPYTREDFAPGTRGEMGVCARRKRHWATINGVQKETLAWQQATASGALFAYCESCAWELMLETRAKRLREARKRALLPTEEARASQAAKRCAQGIHLWGQGSCAWCAEKQPAAPTEETKS